MKLPTGITLDVDVANRRARICLDPAKIEGAPKGSEVIPAFCLPYVDLDDTLAELKRAGFNVRDESRRFLDRVKGWFR